MTVKRYDPEGYDGLSALMRETEYGDWVRGEDYDALLSLNAELLESLERLVGDFEAEIHNEYDGTSMLKSRLAECDYARAAIAKARSQS